MSLNADEAAALAAGLLDQPTPAPVPGEAVLAVAWALKDLCYQAWNSAPTRATRAAEVLRAVFDAGVPPAQARQIEALAEWTAGIALVIQGRMAQAVQAFDWAGAALREVGLNDPAAQTQVPKIMALSMLGQHQQAIDCAEVTQRELIALGNVGAAARVSQNLGNLHLRRDAYAQAARFYREAAVLFARLGDHASSVFADIGLADALTSMGDFDEALRIYARARMRAGNRGLELALALVDESVALVGLACGRYHEALRGMESARRRYQALALAQHLAIAEKQLADAYLELRLLPEALALLDTAVATFAELDLPDEQAWAMAQRGRAQALLGQTEADRSFAAAAELFLTQENAVGVSTVALARAELALTHADAELALGLAEQAATGFEAAGQAVGYARAGVIHAQALLGVGRTAAAREAFERTLERARARGQLTVQVRCLTGLGLVALAEHNPGAARDWFEASIELFEEQRRALPGDEMRRAFLSDHLRPYQELLRLAVTAGEGDQALLHLDRFRARALDERLLEAGAGSPRPDDPDVTRLRERLNWLYRRVQRLQEEAEESTTLNEELLATECALLEHARRQRLGSPLTLGGRPDALNIEALRAALHSGDALVAYGALDDELFACVVTPERVVLLRHLAGWSEVLEALRSARFQIETLCHGAAALTPHMAQLTARTQARMARLHALVWAPLASALGVCRRVVVVPHAQLGALPFAALVGASGALGQTFELAVAPSARAALRGLRQTPTPARRALVLGESSRLLHAEREAMAVAANFEHSQVFVGEQATIATLCSHAPEADVVHLACHAQFRADNPRFSALHLVDGALTAEQAESLGLKPCTVVLSACETGSAELASGDEMVGLVRAFLVAGAARVLASQWPVDDEITSEFMVQFYGELMRGQPPAAALRRTQAAVMAVHPHPYFWAAFTLYGGW